jgi:D-glycero-alpha-D-manno-heptose-7-phosphate kinase
MIIVQTPLRISLFGGGTDFPSFFKNEDGGCVLSSSIDKYIFVTIKRRFDQKLVVGYTQTEMTDTVDGIQHELIREAFRMTGIEKGVEIATMGDIPSAGTGLGSSSTVTVGSLNAMYTYLGKIVPADRLAQEACQIEIERIGKPIGLQDQYIAAFGGIRFIEFTPDEKVLMEKIELLPYQKRQLDENLLLFYTGITRKSDRILGEQETNTSKNQKTLCEMKRLAYQAKSELQKGNLGIIGELLHESWTLKKKLASKISNNEIDILYQSARDAGAIGGKITGAGGGGFLLLYCPPENQEDVRKALHCLQELTFRLEPDGTKVIFNYQRGL